MKRLRSFGAFSILAVALLLPHAAGARVLAKKGRIYDGRGIHLNRYEDFSLDFKTSSRGTRIAHFFTTFFTVSCGGNTVFEPDTGGDLGTSIGRRGGFTLRIQTRDPTSHSRTGKLVISGRFGGSHLAAGTVSYHGTGSGHGCNMSRRFKTKLRPLLDRFAGTTSAGTAASFYRTIEAKPKATDFDFGEISGRCPDGSHEPKTTTSVYAARIRHRRFGFSSPAFTTDGEAFFASGTFSSATAASGTVEVAGRDDCSFSGVRWSATRVGHRITGPLNFPTLSP